MVLGSGGREHALAWKIRQSPSCDHLFVAPGNAGTAQVAKNVEIDPTDFDAIANFVKKNAIDLLVVGPEVPLVLGIADYFEEHMPGLKVIGPKKEGAMLEGSKSFAKKFMKEYGIPTASYLEVSSSNIAEGIAHLSQNDGPYVLKADGLAAGKGVLIIEERETAISELKEMLGGKFGDASQRVVIEQFLKGIEFSAFVITDGKYFSILPMAKDYKRIGERDTGLNTGGMGSVSPVPFVDNDVMDKVKKRIILPTLDGLLRRNIDYLGFIFFGLILVDGDPYVIEYNCRLGDPETQSILPRLETDLVELMEALYSERLYEIPLGKSNDCATTVVLVSGGYPGSYEKGKEISNLEDARGSIIFHAGTRLSGQRVLTNGGRVMGITSLAPSMQESLEKCVDNAQLIEFEGKYYRRDIGFDLR